MALTHFCFGNVGRAGNGIQAPAMIASTFGSEGIAPSGSNQQTAANTQTGFNIMCRVVTDTAVYVAFGANPNALTGTTVRVYMPANAIEYFAVEAGHKAAVVTA